MTNCVTPPRRFKALFSGGAKKVQAFNKNKDGIAAVEFAILAPIMVALYFGVVEISLIINADKLTSHATNVAGDLATQVANMDSDDAEDVFEATLATMSLKPAKASKVGVEILSYNIDSSGNIQQIGRATLNGGFIGPAYDPSTIGPRLLSPTSGAVVARIQYPYESVTYKFVEKFTTLEETFILKPRSSADIPFSLDGSPGEFNCTGNVSVTCS
jgi:Flp pilus assembly pilin Flp